MCFLDNLQKAHFNVKKPKYFKTAVKTMFITSTRSLVKYQHQHQVVSIVPSLALGRQYSTIISTRSLVPSLALGLSIVPSLALGRQYSTIISTRSLVQHHHQHQVVSIVPSLALGRQYSTITSSRTLVQYHHKYKVVSIVLFFYIYRAQLINVTN